MREVVTRSRTMTTGGKAMRVNVYNPNNAGKATAHGKVSRRKAPPHRSTTVLLAEITFV